MSRGSSASPRSLADSLRAFDDAQLAALFTARPDLATPVPPDMTVLAMRAAARPSVERVLDRLDEFTLAVVEAMVLLDDPPQRDQIAAILPQAGHDDIERALERLTGLGLLWEVDLGLRLVRTVREACPDPAGLGKPLEVLLTLYAGEQLDAMLEDLGLPPARNRVDATYALVEHLSRPDVLDGLLAEAPEAARAVLRQLADGPPIGEVAEGVRHERRGRATSGVSWLLAHGILVAIDVDRVALPREVGTHLRGGAPFQQVTAHPPELRTRELPVNDVDRAGAGQCLTAVRLTEDLLELWSVDPPGVLRTGGLGVRDLRKAAGTLDVSESTAALLIETAFDAGLVGRPGDVPDGFLPTPAFDDWVDQQPAYRWSVLASAWLASPRAAGLVGTRLEGDRAANALSVDVQRSTASAVRREVLGQLAALPPGTATDADAMLARLRWLAPRRAPRLREQLVGWTLREAEVLGVTGRGALTSAGRRLLDGDLGVAADALSPHLPEPLDHVLLQADLTAVAPGPLVPDLARELALAADVESTGGATVFRFGEASVRRALDAGRTADGLHELLAKHSRTPVPQGLSYLIDDVARRHGRIRVGVASSYLRCDDETVLAEVLVHRRTAGLRLRRLAPTVLAAQAPPDRVLEVLRQAGFAPAAESAEGAVVVPRPAQRRALPHPPVRSATFTEPSARMIAAAVKALRAGDRVATAPRVRRTDLEPPSRVMPRSTAAATLESLRAAADGQSAVWIGYVNAQGRATQRVVEPISVDGGYLRAYDHLRDEVRTFAIHRITGVAELEDDTGS